MLEQGSGPRSAKSQCGLANYCEWWPMSGTPCYGPAGFVLVRPSGETLRSPVRPPARLGEPHSGLLRCARALGVREQ
jgi:hypothetical protein